MLVFKDFESTVLKNHSPVQTAPVQAASGKNVKEPIVPSTASVVDQLHKSASSNVLKQPAFKKFKTDTFKTGDKVKFWNTNEVKMDEAIVTKIVSNSIVLIVGSDNKQIHINTKYLTKLNTD